MKKEALDLLRKYIGLRAALVVMRKLAAAGDYYDEDIPQVRREAEETWNAFVGAVEVSDGAR